VWFFWYKYCNYICIFQFVAAVDTLQKSPHAGQYLQRLCDGLDRLLIKTKNLQAFSSDRASVMRKAAKDLSKQLRQQFVRAECLAHTLNNAGLPMGSPELNA
jgi:hypothetical protein